MRVLKNIENQDKNSNLFETVRAGVIQNYVEVDGLTRRVLYIKAAENRLIADVERWMEFHKATNTTSHVHDTSVAEEVYEIDFEYVQYAKKLLERLEVSNGLYIRQRAKDSFRNFKKILS